MISYKIKYALFTKVKIKELKLYGKVLSVIIFDRGIKYEVRYFDNCEPKNVWFYEDELEN